MKKLLKIIFSIKNENLNKVITVFGIRIKFKKSKTSKCAINAKLNNLEKQLCSLVEERKSVILNFYQDLLQLKYANKPFNVEDYLSKITKPPKYLFVDKKHNFLNILLNCDEWDYKEEFNTDKVLITWELFANAELEIIKNAIATNKKLIFCGDSFLRSINTNADKKALDKYQKGISFTFDDLTTYFDSTRSSRMEQMLNDKTLIITEEQRQRARSCIDKIVETHLTKYNHQPIFEPKIGRKGVKKILVVDQSYGDNSILKGSATDETFVTMLEVAIKENPDADIIVKTHPDTMTGTKGGYYTGLEKQNNVYKMTAPINPISLIKYCDKVYVCSTQLGFEALMCGKEVHTFGMPFYAGWGLTVDAQKCERRMNERTLEELFYIAYIMYTYYVNPDKNCRCEIEEAMDYLLKLRDEYFVEIKKN